MSHVIFFVLYSIYFYFSLFFLSIVYSATTGGAGRDATGPARAAQQHGTEQGGRRAGRGGRRVSCRSKEGGGQRQGAGASKVLKRLGDQTTERGT